MRPVCATPVSIRSMALATWSSTGRRQSATVSPPHRSAFVVRVLKLDRELDSCRSSQNPVSDALTVD
jgi:hypothetical protein